MSTATQNPIVREFPINVPQRAALHRLEEALRTGASSSEIAAARSQVVTTYLSFAAAVGRRYRDRGIEAEDVQQIAYLGLVKAAHRWDPEVGTVFLAFAAPTIAGEIKRHFRDHLLAVRVPRSLQDLHAGAAALQEDLQQRLGRDVSDAELAAAAGVAVDSIRAQRAAYLHCRVASMDQPELHSIVEQVSSADAAADLRRVEDRMLAEQAICMLTPRERGIVKLRYEDGLSQQDIAAIIGVSQMHISRLLRSIAGKLRDGLAEHDDQPGYLPRWAQLAG